MTTTQQPFQSREVNALHNIVVIILWLHPSGAESYGERCELENTQHGFAVKALDFPLRLSCRLTILVYYYPY